MKTLPTLLALLSAALFAGPAAGEELKEDFLKASADWKAVFPPEMPATVRVEPEAWEGKPALRIEVAEGMVEAWKGKISFPVALPSAGSYVLTFQAKAEPADVTVELSVWGSLPDRPKNIGPRTNVQLLPEWQEFVYDFSCEAADPAASITWGNLARGGRTIFLSDIRLKKLD